RSVNFYVAYYASQHKQEAIHSPRSCIPGGGWKMTNISRRVLDRVSINGEPLEVNRVQIQKGDFKQLVYYWFQQRGRVITSEYATKWYLFWDGLTRNRSDGSLVRLTANLGPGEDWERADARLVEFAGVVSGELGPYLPD
ncbi:MAG: EpsI family protein, partial [Gammaproteobacteria bacterium]|nr:EpsI family protein [Gammaproteobacteria bacterium]